ncbi:MAG: hypothetical protein U0Q16_17305 [Bryobacteraceae bacterium]
MKLFACALVVGAAAMAQQPVKGSWERVEKLTPGKRVELRTRTGAKISGKLFAARADSIDIERKDRVQTTQASDVRRIRVRSLKRRFRNAGLVAAAGAGGGALLGVAANRASYNDRFQIISPRLVTAAVSVALAAVAFGIAMIPPASVTVYEVR